MHDDLAQLLADGRISKAQAEVLDPWQPGGFVRHRSWGAGKITGWDLTQGKLQVDFEGKPDHTMALKFAMQNLERLESGHILAQRAQDSERLIRLAQEDPKALVEEVVASHGGSISLDKLEDTLKGTVVRAEQYKSWWEAAKRRLRGDRRFVLPLRRTEPLVVRSAEIDASELLLEDLRAAVDLKAKARVLTQIVTDLDSLSDREGLKIELGAIEERLGSGGRSDLPGAIELMQVRDDLLEKLGEEGAGVREVALVEFVRDNRERLGEHLRSLPVASIRRVLEAYPEAFGDEDFSEIALSQVHGAGARGVAELTRFLIDKGKTGALLENLKVGIADRALDQDVLAWLCRERRGAAAPLFTMDLAGAVIHELERDYYDEESRGGNRLRDLVTTDRDLLGDFIEDASYAQARNFGRRLLGSPAFDDLTRKSLMARLVRIQPRLQELLSTEAARDEDELLVSWGSLERRKAELDDLVNRQMPENVKEIQVARSYGDLRENFEYKAAKEMKAVLERRKMELERDLGRAKGTNFANADTSKVSLGTQITLTPVGGGDATVYTILGAWDGDVDKGILSYQSATASSLLGKPVGTRVDLAGLPHEITAIQRASI